MIIHELKLNNVLKFKDFEMDLSIPRTTSNSPILQQHKKYPNLKYKKFVILLGANASGKTTLGLAICMIQNFLSGKTLKIDLFSSVFEELKEGEEMTWEIIFSLGDYMYQNKTVFNSMGIVFEQWRMIKLSNLFYGTLKKKLLDSDEETVEYLVEGEMKSYYISEQLKKNKYGDCGFLYSFSGDHDDPVDMVDIDSKKLSQVMRSFDSSIESVTDSQDVPGSKVITFVNGYKEIINDDGSLAKADNSILSTGTKESIFLSYLICILEKEQRTFYVDEKMSHVHSEIEQQIIQIMITLIDRSNGQIFVTSHNSDLLNMNFPNYNFMLLRKSKDGTISELIQPEKIESHHDRNLRSIVEKDVFSTAPQLDGLIDLHDSFFDEEDNDE